MKRSKILTALVILAGLFSASTAQAFFAISATAEDINSSASSYNYRIQTSCVLGDCSSTVGGQTIASLYETNKFLVPYFSDAGITSLFAPSGWLAYIDASNDVFGLGPNAGVIRWTASATNEISLEAALSGFGYTSTFSSSVKAPFKMEYTSGNSIIGDPAIPASPYAIAAGLTLAPVPVPAAVWLFGTGLIGIFGLRKPKTY